MMEAVDLSEMEKHIVDGGENEPSGESSRLSSSTLLGNWDGGPNKTRDMVIDDGSGARSVSPLYLIYLTISTGGLQVVWTAIMSQGSPYLSSLGLPAYLISLVWLAGPMSGALVQPYIGILSDRCQHPSGRRKPFIVVGTISTIMCMLALPWTTEVIAIMFSLFDGDGEERAAVVLRGMVATAWIWALNIAIQPVQAGIRALIVDCCPPRQQVQASAYASSVVGVGNILGYASGFVSLPQVVPWLGNTQFKGLCVIASVALGSTVSVTCLMVKEKKVLMNDEMLRKKAGVMGVLGQFLKSSRTMPRSIRRVCMVQFFAWMGWFPFLFYITTYIGDIYQAEVLSFSSSASASASANAFQPPPSLGQDSIRHGTFAMILFATTALLTNLILPLFISTPTPPSIPSSLSLDPPPNPPKAASTNNEKSSSHPHTTLSTPRQPSNLTLPSLTLPRAWTASHLLTSTLLLSTALTTARAPSTTLVALLGISWALTQWAPFALISAEITKEPSSLGQQLLRFDRSSFCDVEQIFEGDDGRSTSTRSIETQTGTILGFHNMAIATPQILAAVGSSAIFWLLGKWGIGGAEAIGWVLRAGGLAAMVAAVLAGGI